MATTRRAGSACLLTLLVLLPYLAAVPLEGPEYWQTLSQNAIRDTLAMSVNSNIAKNVILFLGDGMGPSTVAAARILKGQKMGVKGEETWLSWERFPHTCLLKTYSVDRQVADSSSSATALLSGVKTNFRTVGVSLAATRGDCSSTFGTEVTSILQWAQQEGKDTGFVTTTRVTHSTPAALYAHSVDEAWESDHLMPPNASSCKDTARQLVEDRPGQDIKVILGGGRSFFDTAAGGYKRQDGQNLVDVWTKQKRMKNAHHLYVASRKELLEADLKNTSYLLGLFSPSHMQYETDRVQGPSEEPSLAEMTAAAIRVLQHNAIGYFLLVEAGRIDHAHHDNNAARALEDTIAMEAAVLQALLLTSREDTLVLVTADHSQGLTINGYPERGTSILGLAGTSPVDQMPYTTLTYASGPGPGRATTGDSSNKDFRQAALVPLSQGAHSGEDVTLYAIGPMAHLFHGVQEQTYVAYAMAYASCIGVNKQHCARTEPRPQHGGVSVTLPFLWLPLLAACLILCEEMS